MKEEGRRKKEEGIWDNNYYLILQSYSINYE
jgi:hypothetical protein